jgi:hypothetical protein
MEKGTGDEVLVATRPSPRPGPLSSIKGASSGHSGQKYPDWLGYNGDSIPEGLSTAGNRAEVGRWAAATRNPPTDA